MERRKKEFGQLSTTTEAACISFLKLHVPTAAGLGNTNPSALFPMPNKDLFSVRKYGKGPPGSRFLAFSLWFPERQSYLELLSERGGPFVVRRSLGG